MREILFRGKTDETGRWIYGDLEHDTDGVLQILGIHSAFAHNVIPETVGQFTGLTDKNGVKIFEGDICRFVVVDRKGKAAQYVGTVKFDDGSFVIDTVTDNFEFELKGTFWEDDNFEVIGNIHDSSGLLTENAKEEK